jgi:hypothetical protein
MNTATAQVIPMHTNEFNGLAPSEVEGIGLASKALLVSLTISMPSGTKKDKDASTEAAASHQASEEAVSVNKRLWSKTAMQLFAKPANTSRKLFAEQTSPWSKGGRILAVIGYEKLLQEMQRQEKEFWTGVELFVDHVDEHMQEARRNAGTLYDDDDYTLDREELRAKFAFDLQFLPLPSENDFRVALSQVEVARIKEALTISMKKSYDGAVKDTWQRLHDVTRSMAERLQAFDNDETKIIRSAIIDNVTELTDILPSLNLSGDPELTKLAHEARQKLTGHTAKNLKEDNVLRKQVKLDSAALARRVDSYLGLL